MGKKSIALALALIFALAFGNAAQAKVYTWGARGGEVKQLQQRLRQLGYYEGDGAGVYDYETLRAVRAYQRKNGVEATGAADDALLSLMGAEDYPDLGYGINRENEIWLLASFIEGAGAGESYGAKTALGAIIVNRMKSRGFPSALSEVVFSLGEKLEKPGAEAMEAAQDALRGFDPSNGALYFWLEDAPLDMALYKRIGGVSFGAPQE